LDESRSHRKRRFFAGLSGIIEDEGDVSYLLTKCYFSIRDLELNIDFQESAQEMQKECSYFDSGSLKSECYYQRSRLHGSSRFYSEEGNLISETWFIQGKRQGIAKFYYPNGALYAIKRFRDDLPIKKQEYFYENGKVKTLEEYLDGALHGQALLNWPNGQLKRRTYFSKGTKIKDELFDENGQPI
jgi:antitoxin component YwqK of YwqJK toxin-antitoxin module